MKQKIDVLLADAQVLVRIGLKHIISQHSNIRIVGETTDTNSLLEAITSNKVQVILFDYNHPNFSADLVQRIKQLSPTTEVLVISADNDKSSILKVIEYGAKGFLTKECDEQEIISAILATAKGDKFLCHKVIDIIIEQHLHKEKDICDAVNVSSRENEIIKLTAKGWNAKTIANHLFLSTHTVYTHKKNIMKKLKLKSTSEIILYAIQNKLVSESELA